MKNKTIKSLLLVLPLALELASCNSQVSSVSSQTTNTAPVAVTVGTMSEPGEPILNHIKSAYEALGYTLTIQIFSDFTTPDHALADGSISANLFQHEPYLNTYNTANGTDLFCAAKLYDCVYGAYTKKGYTSLNQLPEGSKITVANDSSNLIRCLNILSASGLITLNTLPATATASDVNSYISTNPKNFKITPISTSLITASLDDSDVALGLVNATYAISAGLTSAQMLTKEADPNHNNANIVASRKADTSAQWLKDLIRVLTSDDDAQFITDTFNGVVTPYFIDNVTVFIQ